jgi:broad specificity phosphatase PhoE
MEAVAVDVVLVSPLSRTVQTALLAIPPGRPFVAFELVRERCGAHPCDKRRTRADLAADFPALDLSLLATEEDAMWTEVREPMPDLIGRARAFLDAVAGRREAAIAVVTHNDFLKALFFDSGLRFADAALRRTFGNAECLSVALTWDAAAAPAGAGGAAAAPVPAS